MSKETLEKLRLVVPGIIVLLFLVPLIQRECTWQSLCGSLKLFEGLLYLVSIVMFGGLYYVLNLRKYILRKPLREIQENIKIKLLEVSNGDTEVLAVKNRLLESSALMNIFYHFVDNDESLKDRAEGIRLNGLIWSSIADVIVISAIMLVPYVVGWFMLGRGHYLVLILIMCTSIIIGRVFLPRITKRHISLSDEQLEMIHLKYKPELRQKIHDVVKEMSGAS